MPRWKSRNTNEQGIRSGRSGWITSFLRRCFTNLYYYGIGKGIHPSFFGLLVKVNHHLPFTFWISNKKNPGICQDFLVVIKFYARAAGSLKTLRCFEGKHRLALKICFDKFSVQNAFLMTVEFINRYISCE